MASHLNRQAFTKAWSVKYQIMTGLELANCQMPVVDWIVDMVCANSTTNTSGD